MIPPRVRYTGILLLLLAIGTWSGKACAQAPVQTTAPERKGVYIGVGFGQDLGGFFGFGVTYWPTPWLSGFVGGGWAIADFGYQTGLEFRLPAQSRTSGFLTAMYGYNGAIHVKGLEKLDAVYTGPTFGGGVMLQQRRSRNYWRFSVNLPIRSQEFLDHLDAVKKMPNVEMQQGLLPVTFGIGFHLGL